MSPRGYGGGGYGGGGGMRIGPATTPQVIKDIMIVTAVAFLLQWVLGFAFPARGPELAAVLHYGGLTPSKFWAGMIWQPVTTLVLHGELWHLAGNMFFLWMFGCPVADRLGSRRFLVLYVGAGIAGGVLNLSVCLLVHILGVETFLFPWEIATIGSSGAVFAVVTYYCLCWPDLPISLLFLPLTFTARWLLPLEFMMEFSAASGTVSHAAHLAGVLMGWLWFRSGGDSPFAPIVEALRPRARRRGHLSVVDEDEDKNSGPVFH